MLHHKQGVPQVAEFTEGLQQPIVVTLMEADGRFIEHVHDASEPGSNLCRKANPLAFTAREGVRFPVKCQVIQTYAVEEAKSSLNLLDDL